MRLELNGIVLAVCLTLLALTWWLGKNRLSRRSFIFSLSFLGALSLPTFYLGHGEIIFLFPTAFVLLVSPGIATFFLILNFLVCFVILRHVIKPKN